MFPACQLSYLSIWSLMASLPSCFSSFFHFPWLTIEWQLKPCVRRTSADKIYKFHGTVPLCSPDYQAPYSCEYAKTIREFMSKAGHDFISFHLSELSYLIFVDSGHFAFKRVYSLLCWPFSLYIVDISVFLLFLEMIANSCYQESSQLHSKCSCFGRLHMILIHHSLIVLNFAWHAHFTFELQQNCSWSTFLDVFSREHLFGAVKHWCQR